MRLLKLLAYALFGYAIYEFIRGAVQEAEARGQLGGGQGRGQDRGQQSFEDRGDQPGQMNFSGPGVGVREETQDDTGGSVPHKVGRGVIS